MSQDDVVGGLDTSQFPNYDQDEGKQRQASPTFLVLLPVVQVLSLVETVRSATLSQMARHFNPQNADHILIVSPCFLYLSLRQRQHQQPHSLHFCKNTPF